MTQRTLRPGPTAVPEPATKPDRKTLPPIGADAETGIYAVECYRVAEIISGQRTHQDWSPTDVRLRELLQAYARCDDLVKAVAELLETQPAFPWGSFAYYVIDRYLHVKSRSEALGALMHAVALQDRVLALVMERQLALFEAIDGLEAAREEMERTVEGVRRLANLLEAP